MNVIHSKRCIENTVGAIAENNGATLVDDPATPEAMLTPETEAEALEWIANGNGQCYSDGDYCQNEDDVTIANPDSEIIDGVDLDDLPPIYEGPAAAAHTLLLPGCYTTTDGHRLLVQDNWSQIIGSHTLTLTTGVYFLIDPTNPDNSFRNLGVLPGETRWDEWSEIEPEGVRDNEEPVLAAIALAVRTGTPKDTAAARKAAAKYDVSQLPTDDRGLPYKGEGKDAYYVSLCHGAAFTISDSLLCCKVCFEEADDERQGFLPTVADALGN